MKDQNLNYIKAKRKVEKEKGFYTHLAIYFSVNIVITIIKVWGDFNSWDGFVDEFTSIDVLSSWVVWGVFVILHFVAFKYGAKWEERKIEEYMKKELSDDSH
ncbi:MULTISPECIES: 2TM domain-containing protein [Winogradskyella]|uniref:2TM domain-containing protein n=1 Tax=Winogradskyella marincola TaxID=3037795 RepID=A0ABT6G2Q4_9FLAO|nr:2TM domain-containing protein [Winogradskyella sp. YYF002]MDG4716315.1 2TM domain-containing protein [Winogradskyella sp. YYF002]